MDTTVAIPMASANADENILAPPRKCYSRFWRDITGTCRCSPSIRALDTIYRTDGSSSTKIIDVPSSFSPPMNKTTSMKAVTIIWKLGVLALELFTLFIKIGYYDDPRWNGFYFSYLTHISLVACIVYSLLSLANTIFPLPNADADGVVSRRTAFTWIMFNYVGNTQLTVSVLYWGLVYDGGFPNIGAIFGHGVVLVPVWLDGLLVNRIPVRLRHWFEISLPTYILYSIWTVLQSELVFGVENPYDEAQKYQIYNVINWVDNPVSSLVYLVVLISFFTTIVQLVLWALSLAGRRYIDADAKDEDANQIND